MSVVKINVLTVNPEMREEIEKRFAGRAGLVESAEGFEGFELLRPVEGQDRYLVYTKWRSEEDFQRWTQSQAFQHGHAQAAAERAQVERSIRESAERRDRLDRQLADLDRETSEIAARISALADPAEKRILVDQAEAAAANAETAVAAAEKDVEAKRAAEASLRTPLQEARAELSRIETESRTLAKIINAATGDDFNVSNIRVFVDNTSGSGTVGQYDPGIDTATSIDDLPSGESVAVFVLADIPDVNGSNIVDGKTAAFDLTRK